MDAWMEEDLIMTDEVILMDARCWQSNKPLSADMSHNDLQMGEHTQTGEGIGL